MTRVPGQVEVRRQLLASARLQAVLSARESARIAQMGSVLVTTLWRGGRIYLCGNGGSAADAQHIAAELVGCFMDRGRKALPAVALTTDASILTAVGNDLGFTEIFSRQVEALVMRRDALVCLSTSGRSENVLAAARTAHRIGARVLALTGAPGEPLASLADLAVRVPSRDTQRIQECHITVGHILCAAVDRAYLAGRKKS